MTALARFRRRLQWYPTRISAGAYTTRRGPLRSLAGPAGPLVLAGRASPPCRRELDITDIPVDRKVRHVEFTTKRTDTLEEKHAG